MTQLAIGEMFAVDGLHGGHVNLRKDRTGGCLACNPDLNGEKGAAMLKFLASHEPHVKFEDGGQGKYMQVELWVDGKCVEDTRDLPVGTFANNKIVLQKHDPNDKMKVIRERTIARSSKLEGFLQYKGEHIAQMTDPKTLTQVNKPVTVPELDEAGHLIIDAATGKAKRKPLVVDGKTQYFVIIEAERVKTVDANGKRPRFHISEPQWESGLDGDTIDFD